MGPECYERRVDSFGGAVANLIGNIISWFLDLGKVVTKIIDAIFGTNWTAGLTSLQDSVLKWGKNENAITLDRNAPTIDYRFNYGDAWNTGYNWGANLFSGNGNDAVGAALSGVPYDELSGQLGDIAGSVGSIEKSVKMSDEDIKSLVDVAERRYVNNVNLTAQTPVITVNGANTGADRRRPPEPRQCHPGHSDRADRLRLHAQHGAARKRIRKEEAGMSVNNFGLFFTRDGTVIRLPVNPEKLPVPGTTTTANTTCWASAPS